jgi:predicted dehydrogenase
VDVTAREPVRWGIISTANIARGAFLPALRAAGDGVAAVVGSRDLERARVWAEENGVERAAGSYEAVIADDSIDAVYIPLPNSMHAEWTIAAIEAGKAVFCEKPLCGILPDAERVLSVAEEHAALLWEAFIFPFRAQSHRLREIIDAGEIGEVQEVESNFHFGLRNRNNVRLSARLEGGALLDVGCYSVRFGRMVLNADPAGAMARAVWAPEGVDEELIGVLDFSGERRLVLSCGFRRTAGDTFSRVLGSEGEIRLTNPFHPRPTDTMTIRKPDGSERVWSENEDEPNFTAAIRHIHRVLHGEESPLHLATQDALGNAVAIDLLLKSARSGRYEGV